MDNKLIIENNVILNYNIFKEDIINTIINHIKIRTKYNNILTEEDIILINYLLNKTNKIINNINEYNNDNTIK